MPAVKRRSSGGKVPLTPQEYLERYNLVITEEQIAKFAEQRRRAKGPPFRFAFEYAPGTGPEVDDEEREREEQNLYDWECGAAALDPDPTSYITLRGLDLDAARRQGEEIWRRRYGSVGELAIGYSIWSADWSCAYLFRVDDPENEADVRQG